MRPTGEAVGRVGEFLTDHRDTLVGAIGTGAVTAAAIGIGVVVNAHGERSHRANGQAGWLRRSTDRILSAVGMTAQEWTSAHVNEAWVNGERQGLMHHGMTDANIYPATEIEQYLRVIEADPDKYKGFPTLPKDDPIPNLDPSAEFTHDEVRTIGSFGIDVLESIMGEDYNPPTEYTLEDAHRILDTSHPRYWYRVEPHGPEDPFTQEETAEILLADPYSPALEPLSEEIRNGPRGTHKNNTMRFYNAVHMYQQNPHYMAEFVQEIEAKGFKTKKLPVAYIVGAVAAFAALDVAKNGPRVESVVTGALAGGVLAGGIGMGLPGEGARMVNAGGHAGRLKSFRQFLGLFRNKPHELVPNSDGTYMTSLDDDHGLRRVASRLVDVVMYGELFGQPRHHKAPGSRKYTEKEGLEAFVDNPPTTVLQALADRSLFGLRPGEGFGPGRRPDEANSIVADIIEPARVRTVYPDLYKQLARQAA